MEKINEKLINDNPIIIPFDCTKKNIRTNEKIYMQNKNKQ